MFRASYHNTLTSVDSTLYPHRWDIVFRHLWRGVPESVLYYLRYLPSREYSRFRRYQDFMRQFAKNLLSKGEATSEGKDVMSILVRANDAEDERAKLSESEVLDQISYGFFFPT
jgi:cytochrome P450